MAIVGITNHPEVLEALARTSPVAIVAIDSLGLVRIWNPEAERTLGWSLEETAGLPVPVDSQLLFHAEGETEVRLYRKDGVPIDVEIRTVFWPEPAGRGAISIFSETGRHRKAEQKLFDVEQELERVSAEEKKARVEARVERRFRELLEAAPDAIIEVDRDGRIVLLNRVTEKMFGYSREELLGKPVEFLVPESVRAAHVQSPRGLLESSANAAHGQRTVAEGRRKDGSRFPVEISLSPVNSEDGFRVTAIIRDISERKQAEDRFARCRKNTRAELELDANREVERANRLKSEFLASMSHELRTPLHTIIGFSELLGEQLEGPLNEKQKRFIDHIHKDSMHLLELINDVLDLSKIEAGRLELRREMFDLAASIEEVLATIGARRRRRSRFDIEAEHRRFREILRGPRPVQADSAQPAEQRREVHAGRADGSRWRRDCGIGSLRFPSATRASESRRRSTKRSSTSSIRWARPPRECGKEPGSALAITKHLVEEHGGSIWVESEPGKGSRFTSRFR